MSNRTPESIKAVNAAWKREQSLVKDGKGTRDWSPSQQNDILQHGKALDDNGDPFQGHHMRSVASAPEEQGNPDNIQFLTQAEHLSAHSGNWHNPTNGYYDPVSKETMDFGEGEIIPCEVMDLSNPLSLDAGEFPNEFQNENLDMSDDLEAGSYPEEEENVEMDDLTSEEEVTSDLEEEESKGGIER